MLISHRKKFIYIKTVKTASTSVEAYFEPWARTEDYDYTDKKNNRQRADADITEAGIVGRRGQGKSCPEGWHSHLKARIIKEKIGNEIWNSYFKFCVIRNPYDRAVSKFNFQHNNMLVDLTVKTPVELQAMFAEFVSIEHRSDKNIWTIGKDIAFDKCIRYENLQDDMAEVCNILDIPWEPSRLKNFKSGVRPRDVYTQLYTPEAKAAIERTHALEFKLFDFKYPGE